MGAARRVAERDKLSHGGPPVNPPGDSGAPLAGAAGSALCGTESPGTSWGGPCSREKGHSGFHVNNEHVAWLESEHIKYGYLAKLSERKTVHQWLNWNGVPDIEATGRRMCLLRRIAVALGIQSHVCSEPGRESGSLHPGSPPLHIAGSGSESPNAQRERPKETTQ